MDTLAVWREWVGRSDTRRDTGTVAPLAALSALPDGHQLRGGFLPPVQLPRRMWAGSRLEFLRPLVVGSSVERRSTIAAVDPKQGRSGPLVFVTVRHEVSDVQGLVL